jgi:predicted nuclease of restriction endonuclease-like RecB superfamily
MHKGEIGLKELTKEQVRVIQKIADFLQYDYKILVSDTYNKIIYENDDLIMDIGEGIAELNFAFDMEKDNLLTELEKVTYRELLKKYNISTQ